MHNALCNDMSRDSEGNIYITGYFQGTVAKLDTLGKWLWAINAGGYCYDVGWSISTDSEGNTHVTSKAILNIGSPLDDLMTEGD